MEDDKTITIRLAAPSRVKPTDEIGMTGLKQFSGFSQEEPLEVLRGKYGALRYQEMLDGCGPAYTAITTLRNVSLRSIEDGRIEPFSLKSEDKARAEFVEQCLEDMVHARGDLYSEALTMYEYGYAPLEIVYKRREGYRKEAERSSLHSDGGVGWAKVSLRAQESTLKWEWDSTERHLVAYWQQPAPKYATYRIPIDRIALFRTTNVKNNPEGRSLLRSAWHAWQFFKRGTLVSWIGAERDVTGIPVLTAPASVFAASPSSAGSATYGRLKQVGENVRNDEQSCVLIPSDVDPETKAPLYTFSLVSSPGSKTMDVPAMTREQERQILQVLFSDFLMLGHEKIGTQALFGGRMGLYSMQVESMLDRFDDVVNRQMISRLALLNGWPMGRLPYFKHGAVSETSLEELGKFLAVYAQAGGQLDPDLDAHLRERVGWPQPDSDYLVPQIGAELEPEPAPKPAKPKEPEEGVPDVDGGDADEDDKPDIDDSESPAPKTKGAMRRFIDKTMRGLRQRQGRFAPGASNALSLLRERKRIGPGDSISHGLAGGGGLGLHPGQGPGAGGGAGSGMGLGPDCPFKDTKDYKAEIESAKVEDVNVADVIATAPHVRRERVRDFIENPFVVPPGKRSMGGALEDLPVLFEADGKKYVFDGHHRLAAMKLLGIKSCRARVIRGGA